MGDVKHIIVTRYNVPLKFADLSPDFSPLSEDWLEHRQLLFRQYCSPSLEQQTDQDFTWLIAFHPDTPARYFDYLQSKWDVCFASSLSDVLDAVRQQVADYEGLVITTRLDNDDSLSKRFVGTTKSVARNFGENSRIVGIPHAIYFKFGLERDVTTGQIYRRDYPKCPFVSLIENVVPGGSIHTALAHAHYDMEKSFNTTIIGNRLPMWTINIHDRNVSNAVKGVLIENEGERSAFAEEFGVLNSV